MLATSDLHRSIERMTVGVSLAMEARRHVGDQYRLGEREHQFQYQLDGHVGATPVETTIEVPFYIFFIADAGSQRDSDLEAPQVAIGFELKKGAGVIPYAYVRKWKRDAGLDYTGASVVAGVHAPALLTSRGLSRGLLLLPNTDTTPIAFSLVLHIAFQGYGTVWDADGAMDAGG